MHEPGCRPSRVFCCCRLAQIGLQGPLMAFLSATAGCVDLGQLTRDGSTALQLAVAGGHADAADLLEQLMVRLSCLACLLATHRNCAPTHPCLAAQPTFALQWSGGDVGFELTHPLSRDEMVSATLTRLQASSPQSVCSNHGARQRPCRISNIIEFVWVAVFHCPQVFVLLIQTLLALPQGGGGGLRHQTDFSQRADVSGSRLSPQPSASSSAAGHAADQLSAMRLADGASHRHTSSADMDPQVCAACVVPRHYDQARRHYDGACYPTMLCCGVGLSLRPAVVPHCFLQWVAT